MMIVDANVNIPDTNKVFCKLKVEENDNAFQSIWETNYFQSLTENIN